MRRWKTITIIVQIVAAIMVSANAVVGLYYHYKDHTKPQFVHSRMTDVSGNVSATNVMDKFGNRLFDMQELADAYQDQAHEADFQKEVIFWDVTVGDGLDA